jgi:hypothetical protein
VDAWNRGAFDEWFEDISAEWEFVPSGFFPGTRVEDLGDTLVALGTFRATGGKSGAETALRWAHVVTFSGDNQRPRNYRSWDEALEAVGLRE